MSPKHGLDSTLLLPHNLSYKVPVPVLPTENRKPKGYVCLRVCMHMCVCQWEGNGAPGEVPAQTSVLPAGWNRTLLTALGFASL